MHDPKLIEAMADLAAPHHPFMRGTTEAFMANALTALCTLHPGVAAILRGEAVAVPREGAGWQPFDYKAPPEGLCWLDVERPETWSDSDDTGRDIGGYTGRTHRVVALAFVYPGNDGPEFDRVEGSEFSDVERDDAVRRFMPLTAPTLAASPWA